MPIVGGGQTAQGAVKSSAGKGGILIVPNPNDGRFTVHIFHDFKKGWLILYDAKGGRVGNRMRLEPGSNAIDENGLTPGIYQLRLEIDGKVENRSIVITQDR